MSAPKTLAMLMLVSAISLVSAQQPQHLSEPNWDEVEQWTKGLRSFQPKNGFVPDGATAIRIAEAVLKPIYGDQHIDSERPLQAHLRNGVWTVVGTLKSANVGGSAVLKLSQSDGRVLFVIHGQ